MTLGGYLADLTYIYPLSLCRRQFFILSSPLADAWYSGRVSAWTPCAFDNALPAILRIPTLGILRENGTKHLVDRHYGVKYGAAMTYRKSIHSSTTYTCRSRTVKRPKEASPRVGREDGRGRCGGLLMLGTRAATCPIWAFVWSSTALCFNHMRLILRISQTNKKMWIHIYHAAGTICVAAAMPPPNTSQHWVHRRHDSFYRLLPNVDNSANSL